MARVNVEEDLYRDQRWIDLIIRLGGDSEKALGALVRAWTVGQEYWKVCSNGIPKGAWKMQKLNDAIIEVGLAHDKGDFILIHNSEKHFAWLRQRVDAGKSGGVASGISRRSAAPEIIEEKPKRGEAGRSKPKQTEASYSSSPSYSSSDSYKEELKEEPGAVVAVTSSPPDLVVLQDLLEIQETIRERKVTELEQRAWLTAFPDARWIIAEVKKALVWEAANPKRRKKLFGRFMANWMMRNWDSRKIINEPAKSGALYERLGVKNRDAG